MASYIDDLDQSTLLEELKGFSELEDIDLEEITTEDLLFNVNIDHNKENECIDKYESMFLLPINDDNERRAATYSRRERAELDLGSREERINKRVFRQANPNEIITRIQQDTGIILSWDYDYKHLLFHFDADKQVELSSLPNHIILNINMKTYDGQTINVLNKCIYATISVATSTSKLSLIISGEIVLHPIKLDKKGKQIAAWCMENINWNTNLKTAWQCIHRAFFISEDYNNRHQTNTKYNNHILYITDKKDLTELTSDDVASYITLHKPQATLSILHVTANDKRVNLDHMKHTSKIVSNGRGTFIYADCLRMLHNVYKSYLANVMCTVNNTVKLQLYKGNTSLSSVGDVYISNVQYDQKRTLLFEISHTSIYKVKLSINNTRYIFNLHLLNIQPYFITPSVRDGIRRHHFIRIIQTWINIARGETLESFYNIKNKYIKLMGVCWLDPYRSNVVKETSRLINNKIDEVDEKKITHGKIEDAFETYKAYKTWGEYYIHSILFSNVLQQSYNSVDSTSNRFGGLSYQQILKQINTL